MAQTYGPNTVKLNESFQVDVLMVPSHNIEISNCNVPMKVKDGVATYMGKGNKAGKMVISGELWASLRNIAVQSRLTTYSDRQKSGDQNPL